MMFGLRREEIKQLGREARWGSMHALLSSAMAGLKYGALIPWLAQVGWAAAEPDRQALGLLFRESFDDPRLLERGWYDGNSFLISDQQPYAGKGCLEYRWEAGGTRPANSSGIRRLFEGSETIYLRCYLRLSPDWSWTGRPYHPHLMHFMTTENEKFRGPAASHLTVYIEPWNGKLRLAAQDIQNHDQPHGLTQGPLKGGYNMQGGCLCGAVRYEATGRPHNVTHCHCADCRRSSGAAFVRWASFRRGEVCCKT